MWCWVLWACSGAPERGGNVPVDGERVGREQAAGETLAFVEVVGTEPQVVRVHRGQREVVWSTGGPDRLALSEEGHVAFWASLDGLPALYVAPMGEAARPLANVGLPRAKGGPPPGFLPPPVNEGELRFEADRLSWTGPDGVARSVPWRSR